MRSEQKHVKSDPHSLISAYNPDILRDYVHTRKTLSAEPISKSSAINPWRFCSGFGQYHSENNRKNPLPYKDISLGEIGVMAKNPHVKEKSEPQWLIFSTTLSRVHKDQGERGHFVAVPSPTLRDFLSIILLQAIST